MQTHTRPLESIGFVTREQKNGKSVSFKCARDFLYYALNFYFPERFSPSALNPKEIDNQELFGTPVPKQLAWTQFHLSRSPQYLHKQGLRLFINNRPVASYLDLLLVNAFGGLFSSLSAHQALQEIERCVDANIACAIDVPVGKKWMLFLDHVMFVHGYDDENLYVLDTLTVPQVPYERIRDDVHYFKLPKTTIKKQWSSLGRVWRVERV